MQRARFAQEFLAELMREPRALRLALLAERSRWLRVLKVGGREELLFELELLLRALEYAFDRRNQASEGRAILGQDFAEPLRAARDALHRASMVARRLTPAHVDQSFQLRAYVERQAGDDQRRTRVSHDILEQRTPEESLLVLRSGLRALQGLTDQLVKSPVVTFQTFSDLAVLGEQLLLTNKYFRPPGALEFRTEYDRVGSVRLLELVKRVSDGRARKALALGFLSCFRLLRYLRYIPAPPVAPPRRAMVVARMAVEEAGSVANYLASDVSRLVSAASEAPLLEAAAGNAADVLRQALASLASDLAGEVIGPEALERVRTVLGDGARGAAGALAQAVEPGASASDIFDGQRARRERAERLRRDLWLLGQLLRACLEDLFPAMRGEAARAFEALAALARFASDFRSMGYYLLRTGDHDPFDRFFAALEALTGAAPSPARDRHLYLEVRRFLPVVERALALVNRRAELVGAPPDAARLAADLQRYLKGGTTIAPPLEAALEDPTPELALAEPPEDWQAGDEEADRLDRVEYTPHPPVDDAESALGSEPIGSGDAYDPDLADLEPEEFTPAPEYDVPSGIVSPDEDDTREKVPRGWRTD